MHATSPIQTFKEKGSVLYGGAVHVNWKWGIFGVICMTMIPYLNRLSLFTLMETIWPKILQKLLSKDAKLEKVLALYQQHPGSLVPWSRAPLKQVSEIFKSVECQRLHDQWE